MKKSLTDLLIFVVSAELTGALSRLFTGDFSDTYNAFEKPPLSPPGAVFSVVWLILYALMGISAYVIYSADAPFVQKKNALKIYALQLAVNFAWSIVFFRFGMLFAGAVLAAVLTVLVVIMIYRFGKISPKAAYLNVPYLLWLCYAVYLAFGTAAGR